MLQTEKPSAIQVVADVRNIARSRVQPTCPRQLAKACARMTQFLRKPEAILWVLSISQAAAMLAFNVVLRAAVS
jgi:hypothetical protein